MSEKVYCIDCKWFHSEIGIQTFTNAFSSYQEKAMIYTCNCPKNLSDTWLRKNGEHNHHPLHLNENNNCKWYEAKTKKKG